MQYRRSQIPRLPAEYKYEQPENLKRAVNKYFTRCYRKLYAEETVFDETGKVVEEMGRPKKKVVPLKDLRGRLLYARDETPSALNLLHSLGMSRGDYRRLMSGDWGTDEHREIMEMAYEMIEAGYVSDLVSGRGDPNGLKFVLNTNFGYAEKSKLTVDGQTDHRIQLTDDEIKRRMEEIEEEILRKAGGDGE